MAHIARYMNELIKLEARVSQADQVLSFFDNDWFKLHPQRKFDVYHVCPGSLLSLIHI